MEYTSIKRSVTYFSVLIMLLAVMDGIVFHWPHNQGWWSLTYGPDRITFLGMPADAWHVLKDMALLVIFMWEFGVYLNSISWWFKLGIFALIAYSGQVLIYNVLIKLF